MSTDLVFGTSNISEEAPCKTNADTIGADSCCHSGLLSCKMPVEYPIDLVKAEEVVGSHCVSHVAKGSYERCAPFGVVETSCCSKEVGPASRMVILKFI